MHTCPNCDGSGHRPSMTIARIRGRSVAFVECAACVGTGVWPPGQLAPKEIRAHKPPPATRIGLCVVPAAPAPAAVPVLAMPRKAA